MPTDADQFSPKNCSINVFKSDNNPFILPDTTGVLRVSDEKFYFLGKSIKRFHCVGIPLNPNVFVQITNDELFDNKTYVVKSSVEDVKHINTVLYNTAFDQVLSNSKQQLELLEKSM